MSCQLRKALKGILEKLKELDAIEIASVAWLSNFFQPQRGDSEGCTLSPYSFFLAEKVPMQRETTKT